MTSLTAELRLARTEIREGRFQRTMALLAAFSAIVSGFEAYVQHQRGAFRDWLMWTPVWLTPPTVVAAGAAILSGRAARRVLPLVAVASLVDGVVGFVFHIRGIARMPGGFALGRYNVVMGPPIFAPLLTCTVGVIGLVGAFARRERLDYHALPDKTVSRLAAAERALVGAGKLTALEARIAHGRFQRWMAVASAVFAVLAGGEAYFEHLRGSFNRWEMWTPVWLTPPMVLAAVGAAVSDRVAQGVLPFVSVVTFLDGLLGFGLHLQGIERMPGGFANFRFNVTLGPPLFAPLLMSSVGTLGLVASLLRRRRG